MSFWLASESRRVYRGSSWFVAPRAARVALRRSGVPVRCGSDLSFRLVRRCT